MYGDGGTWHWGIGFGHGIVGIIFWIVIIAAIVVLVRGIGGGRRSEPSALELLKQRYARGDITQDEFERMKRELEK